MDRPKVGVGVIIAHNGKMLMLRRKVALGGGTWAPPGGHLEGGEAWEECAVREVEEETGIALKDVTFVGVTNDIFPDKHYVTIIMQGHADSDKFTMCEPEKYENYGWYGWNELPEPRFLCFENFVKMGAKPSYLK
jgi:8-oxo-dGTP diphosphatase